MVTCKVSYKIIDSNHPGGLINLDHYPEIGEMIQEGDISFEILDIEELLPPRGSFFYIHATCKQVQA